MTVPIELEGQLHAALASTLAEYAAGLAAAGADLASVGGADGVAAAVAAVLPRPNRLAVRLGPVYATGQLRRLLPGTGAAPITDQAVRARRSEGRLIGVPSADGRWAWPSFQFRVVPGRLVPRADVLELWRLLPWDAGTVDPLGLAVWFTGRRRDLEERTPLQWLDGHGLDDRLRSTAGRMRRRAAP